MGVPEDPGDDVAVDMSRLTNRTLPCDRNLSNTRPSFGAFLKGDSMQIRDVNDLLGHQKTVTKLTISQSITGHVSWDIGVGVGTDVGMSRRMWHEGTKWHDEEDWT